MFQSVNTSGFAKYYMADPKDASRGKRYAMRDSSPGLY
jgi:hypothetical protein